MENMEDQDLVGFLDTADILEIIQEVLDLVVSLEHLAIVDNLDIVE